MTTRHSLPSRAGVAVIVLLPYFGLGVLAVRAAGEPERTTRSQQIDCDFYGDIAQAPLAPNAGELARRVVRDAAKSYEKRGCEQVTGPLPPQDSEANRPAPSPSRTD